MKVTRFWIEKNFEKFNKEYFQNTLPTPNVFIVTNSRRILGQCGSKNCRAIHPSFYIKISNFYDRTEHDFQNTLIHEMIHLYFQSKGDWKEGHGRKWQNMARSFDRYGWDIQTKECNNKGKTHDGTIATRTILTFEEVKSGKIFIACISSDKMKVNKFVDYINNNSNYREPTLYYTNSDKFSQMRVCHKAINGRLVLPVEFHNEWLPYMTLCPTLHIK